MQNQDFSLNLPSRPTHSGEQVTAYLAGLCKMTPAQRTGEPAPPNELVRAAGRVTAKLGGVDAEARFAGLTPGTLALEQANILVPALAPGEHDLEISVDGVPSSRVKISVAAP